MTNAVSNLNFMSSWDLIGSQPTRMKVWAISDTKPALNHWSFSRHRPLPPGPDWFTLMQILSFQTGFSRFQALGIGPQLLKRPVPAGCRLKQPTTLFLSCNIPSTSGGLQIIHQADILRSYPEEPHTNFKFLNMTVFSEQKTELEEHLSTLELWTPYESWLRSTSLFFETAKF